MSEFPRCRACLRPRDANPDGGGSFCGPCPHCGTEFGTVEVNPPKLHVWVCPYCLTQLRPSTDHNLGLNKNVNHVHRNPGERGMTTVQAVRVEVALVEAMEPRPIPRDRTPIAEGEDRE